MTREQKTALAIALVLLQADLDDADGAALAAGVDAIDRLRDNPALQAELGRAAMIALAAKVKHELQARQSPMANTLN